MFFVGSLSSILPYLTTIIAMCVYVVMGQPTKDFLIEDLLRSGKTEPSIEVSETRFDQDIENTCAFAFVTPPPTAHRSILHKSKELKPELPHPNSSYHFLAFAADGNKAPPVFI